MISDENINFIETILTFISSVKILADKQTLINRSLRNIY